MASKTKQHIWKLSIVAVLLLFGTMAGFFAVESHAYAVIMGGQYIEWVYTDEDGRITLISEEPMAEPSGEAPAENAEEAMGESNDSEGIFIPFDAVPLSESLQRLLWEECQKYGIDFCFALGTIQLESDFKAGAIHHNTNGSTDRGICQVNSCWIKTLKQLGMITSADDLFDPATGIRCGMWELGQCVAKYGNTERAYAYFNTGSEKVKSNKASRTVWKYKQEWETRL